MKWQSVRNTKYMQKPLAMTEQTRTNCEKVDFLSCVHDRVRGHQGESSNSLIHVTCLQTEEGLCLEKVFIIKGQTLLTELIKMSVFLPVDGSSVLFFYISAWCLNISVHDFNSHCWKEVLK